MAAFSKAGPAGDAGTDADSTNGNSPTDGFENLAELGKLALQ